MTHHTCCLQKLIEYIGNLDFCYDDIFTDLMLAYVNTVKNIMFTLQKVSEKSRSH